MSRERRGDIDDQVRQLAAAIVARPEFSRIVLDTIRDRGITGSEAHIYAAAVTQALKLPLLRLGRRWLDEAPPPASRHSASPRTRLSQLLGMTRQSVDAAFGPARGHAPPNSVNPVGVQRCR